MPPKKKEAPKKGGDDDGPNPEEELKILQMRNTTLQLQLRERTEVISDASAAKQAIEAEVETMNRQYNSSKNSTHKMTHEMTKQFEGMQELLVDKITLLSRTVGDLKEELAVCEVTLEQTEQEKDAIIALREQEITALKAKMEDMATEFSGMLNGTLDKMRERIELSSTNNFDASAGVQLQRKV